MRSTTPGDRLAVLRVLEEAGAWLSTKEAGEQAGCGRERAYDALVHWYVNRRAERRVRGTVPTVQYEWCLTGAPWT